MECHVGQWFCCRWLSSKFLCLKVRAMVGWWLIVGGYKVEDSVHSPRHGLWWWHWMHKVRSAKKTIANRSVVQHCVPCPWKGAAFLPGSFQTYVWFLLERVNLSVSSEATDVGWDVLLWTHVAVGETRPAHHGRRCGSPLRGPASRWPATDGERLVSVVVKAALCDAVDRRPWPHCFTAFLRCVVCRFSRWFLVASGNLICLTTWSSPFKKIRW